MESQEQSWAERAKVTAKAAQNRSKCGIIWNYESKCMSLYEKTSGNSDVGASEEKLTCDRHSLHRNLGRAPVRPPEKTRNVDIMIFNVLRGDAGMSPTAGGRGSGW